LNEKILHACNGSWENPGVIDNLLYHQELRGKVASTLCNDLDSFLSLYYLGPKHFLKYRSIRRVGFPWGWKEPRNTFTLPLWLDIFPKARIIHIYRNGIDVAKSLAKREEARLEKLLRGDKNIIESQRRQMEEYGALLYLVRKV
jgi:hypothetical protein